MKRGSTKAPARAQPKPSRNELLEPKLAVTKPEDVPVVPAATRLVRDGWRQAGSIGFFDQAPDSTSGFILSLPPP